jgi:hypothetical protein
VSPHDGPSNTVGEPGQLLQCGSAVSVAIQVAQLVPRTQTLCYYDHWFVTPLQHLWAAKTIHWHLFKQMLQQSFEVLN